jgi:tRNA pseudouridine13 synthase
MNYLSKIQGIGGKIKSAPEDFLVEEIATDGSIFELGHQVSHPNEPGNFTQFVLQKKNWSTSSAISEIANCLRMSQKNFNIAGTKDKISISTQLASVRGDHRDALRSLTIKDISINGAWTAHDRVRLGDLLGNRFTMVVRDTPPGVDERVIAISSDLGGKFPNYFGEQRFGSSRKNTHLIGQKILQGDLEGAISMFLCDSSGEKNLFAVDARKRLSETQDYSLALKEYPKHLRLERSIIAYLAKNPKKHANALRCLPRNILLLFIHAFQSDLFNRLLSERISEGEVELEHGEYFCGETFGFPDMKKNECEGWIAAKLIGYTSPVNEREKKLMEEIGIKKENFRLKDLPEISSKGSYRTLMAPMKEFSFKSDSDTSILFRFSLASGSYATVAMREFLDPKMM